MNPDLLIIGGGATGLGIAWDAVLRGLRVILIEKGDLAHGTSGRYHGLLHSGGRYAISDPVSAADCAQENLILRRMVPHVIEDTGGLFLSVPGDEEGWPDRWIAACQDAGVNAEEISTAAALQREPLLNPEIQRVYRVNDASLDSFDLLHALAFAIREVGGEVLLRHRLRRLLLDGERIVGAEVERGNTGELVEIHAPLTINASGPWAGQIAGTAGISVPIVPGKGTMLAMAKRMTHTVLNRCAPPSDGDIIVPVGTVAVLGTTDIPVEDPDRYGIEDWEVDLLLEKAAAMIPTIGQFRPLRAWAGVRPLYRPPETESEQRTIPRAHAILDHAVRDGMEGLLSVVGGKLTTFRLMAEEAVDLACRILNHDVSCCTADSVISPPEKRHYFTLPERLEALETRNLPQDQNLREVGGDIIICECELVTRAQLQDALEAEATSVLNDLRRETRLGMGPCQAGFCAVRGAGLLAERKEAEVDTIHPLLNFLQERWKGIHPVAWGHNLRQAELHRLIYLEVLGVQHLPRERDPDAIPSERDA